MSLIIFRLRLKVITATPHRHAIPLLIGKQLGLASSGTQLCIGHRVKGDGFKGMVWGCLGRHNARVVERAVQHWAWSICTNSVVHSYSLEKSCCTTWEVRFSLSSVLTWYDCFKKQIYSVYHFISFTFNNHTHTQTLCACFTVICLLRLK